MSDLLQQLALISPGEIEVVEPDRDCWATPWSLFREFERRWGKFDLDVCCLAETAKAARFFTPAEDGLAQPWDGRWFCNPPFSLIDPWVSKTVDQLLTNPRCDFGLLLLPSRTARPWYRILKLLEADGLCQIIEPEGRIQYVPPPGAKPSSNMEDSLIVPCWPKFQPMQKYRQRAA